MKDKIRTLQLATKADTASSLGLEIVEMMLTDIHARLKTGKLALDWKKILNDIEITDPEDKIQAALATILMDQAVLAGKFMTAQSELWRTQATELLEKTKEAERSLEG